MAFSVSRIWRIFFFFLGVLCLIGSRLCFLQVIETDKLSASALASRITEAPVRAVRGDILDRHGLPLTNNASQYCLIVFPSQIHQPEAALSVLAGCGFHSADLRDKILHNQRPFLLRQGVAPQDAVTINAAGISGVIAIKETKRYAADSLAAHVIGYINAADNQGVSGIEAMYDSLLRGSESSYIAAMVDAGQRIIPGLGYKRITMAAGKKPGSVILTLDKRIQGIVESVLNSHVTNGAIIVMNPWNGEILAMASRPNFDPDRLEAYLDRQSAPLVNRAVMNYQPGSIFKLVVAAAALESNVIKPQDRFFDKGYIDVNNIRFKGWDFEKGPRGLITFSEAMAYSSNPVFIEVGSKLGAERLLLFAQKLGLGRSTGVLDGEASGNLPDTATVYDGDLANLSIGQGTLEATPLQVAALVAALVNDGVITQPHLVSRLIKADGSVSILPKQQSERVMSKKTASQIRDMMQAVTEYGTGIAAQVSGHTVAGKTGSAETGRTNPVGKGINHAWFAGYAPADKPEYVVVVFVEEGMSGSDIAAPLFAQTLERIFALRK